MFHYFVHDYSSEWITVIVLVTRPDPDLRHAGGLTDPAQTPVTLLRVRQKRLANHAPMSIAETRSAP
jgi:hypothetical protein